jgi:hypothetical protein
MKRSMMLALPFAALAVAMPTQAQVRAPSLEGKWVGTAQVTTCGTSGGTAEVVLRLDDKGYNPPPHTKDEAGMGTVSGPVQVNGTSDGVVALNFDPGSGAFESAIGSKRSDQPQVGLMASVKSPFSTYWVKLKPGDAWMGMGKFQSLTGTLSHPSAQCPAQQDAGQVLRVTLKKQ